MIEIISGLPDSVVAFSAEGQITGQDYEEVIIPAIDAAFERHEKIRLLYLVAPK